MANIYKVGNMVRVRPDLKQSQTYGGQSVTRDMEQLAGKIVRIKRADDDSCDMSSNYMIEGSAWNWTNEMFVPIDINADKAFSMLVNDEISEQFYLQTLESQGIHHVREVL